MTSPRPETLARRLGPRLVGYVRVSGLSQASDGGGLGIQETSIRAWAREQGYRLLRVHADPGVAGTVPLIGRPGLIAALSDVREKRAQGVIVAGLDRLARDLIVQEAVIAEIRRLGAEVYSARPGEADLLDAQTEPTRVLLRQFVGALSQYDAAMVRARLDAGRQRKKAAGGYSGGRPGFGDRAQSKQLVEDPAERAALAHLIELRRVGMSYREVAATMTAEGYLCKEGGSEWHPMTVRRLVHRHAPDLA